MKVGYFAADSRKLLVGGKSARLSGSFPLAISSLRPNSVVLLAYNRHLAQKLIFDVDGIDVYPFPTTSEKLRSGGADTVQRDAFRQSFVFLAPD